MDRAHLLLVGLPLFLLCSDLINLFTPSPPRARPVHNHHYQRPSDTLDFPVQKQRPVETINLGTVNINFCSSCSYRGTAATMKKMLETAFPGIDVVLANHPPPFPKGELAKAVPVVQMGVFAILMAGEHIFPMLGIATPPRWYYNMRANRFGTIACTWLMGNFLQSFLQSSGAFEIYYNDELVFSKLSDGRFPGELELKELIGKRLSNSVISSWT